MQGNWVVNYCVSTFVYDLDMSGKVVNIQHIIEVGIYIDIYVIHPPQGPSRRKTPKECDTVSERSGKAK